MTPGKAKFKPPTTEQQLSAIGLKHIKEPSKGASWSSYAVLYDNVYPKNTIPQSLGKAIVPDAEFFNKMPKPKRDDWLSEHHEAGQSFLSFTRSARNIPSTRRKTIYIVPTSFYENDVPQDVVADMIECSRRFFGMDVKSLKPTGALKRSVPSRTNKYSGNIQVHAGVILQEMKKLVPADAFCVGALTLCDIYPRDEWNFVFGLASLHDRVGVYSLARHMPGFPDEESNRAELTSEERTKLLISACKLMCHEVCHMFGIQHCIYFHCLMNGSNHYEETHSKPFYLCPVCLRKLQLTCGFDVVHRYQRLQEWCLEKGLCDLEQWYRRRQSNIQISVQYSMIIKKDGALPRTIVQTEVDYSSTPSYA